MFLFTHLINQKVFVLQLLFWRKTFPLKVFQSSLLVCWLSVGLQFYKTMAPSGLFFWVYII